MALLNVYIYHINASKYCHYVYNYIESVKLMVMYHICMRAL